MRATGKLLAYGLGLASIILFLIGLATKDGIGVLFSKHLNEGCVIAVMEIRDKGKP